MFRFPSTHSVAASVCLSLALILCSPLLADESHVPAQTPVRMVLHANVKTPTRDGVTLRADVYLPKKEGPFPDILLRTPYSAALGELSKDKTVNERCREFAAEFVASGYAFVIQDCRGTGRSVGVWEPYIHEREDGVDLQNWVMK